MSKDDEVQRSIADHVQWCRDKRDSLGNELSHYRDGSLSIGERRLGEPMTQGSITQIKYLERTIEQLDRVIAAYSPSTDLRRAAE